MAERLLWMKWKIYGIIEDGRKVFRKRSSGIDGILVTVGLCIIALVLCVVMKDALTTFIEELVTNMQTKASEILNSRS